MQAPFYASGFLYNPKTHQILLLKYQQENSTDFLWSTFGGESHEGEEAQSAFQRVVNELLNLDLQAKDIYPIYDYFHDAWDKLNYVFYAEVKTPREFDFFGGDSFSWIAFNGISKLLFTDHSKQDVIVGERVVNAKWRDENEPSSSSLLAS